MRPTQGAHTNRVSCLRHIWFIRGAAHPETATPISGSELELFFKQNGSPLGQRYANVYASSHQRFGRVGTTAATVSGVACQRDLDVVAVATLNTRCRKRRAVCPLFVSGQMNGPVEGGTVGVSTGEGNDGRQRDVGQGVVLEHVIIIFIGGSRRQRVGQQRCRLV